MKLYLISPKAGVRYGGSSDFYSQAVVVAKSAAAARKTHPADVAWDKLSNTWVDTPDQVDAEFLGTAKAGTPACVICASFHAG